MDSDKIIDIISGIEFNIKELPLVVGSLSKYDKLNINNQFELEQFVGKTISVNKEQLTFESTQNNYTNNINNIQSKLIISTCPIIYPYDFIINKEEEKNEYNIFSFGNAYINGNPIEPNKFCNLNSYDIISYKCLLCSYEHVFIFIAKKFRKMNPLQKNYILNSNSNPNYAQYNMNENYSNIIGENENENLINEENYGLNNDEMQLPNYPADEKIPLTWKTNEKEVLKKKLLLYGYNRWHTIRANSSNLLNNKTDQELKAYSNSFIRCIIQLTKDNKDKKEINNFLSNLIQEKDNEPWIYPKADDWGELNILQKAPAWGKRIKYLYYIKTIIDIFKNLRANNKEKRKMLSNFNMYLSEEEKSNINSKINKDYDDWINLLWFLPVNLSFGQTPVSWWNKIHDIDLLRGTYKHGYANYIAIKADKKLCFSSLEHSGQKKDFPSADSITRRLKKVMQIIIKNWNNNELMNLNQSEKFLTQNKKIKELKTEEKKEIFELLIDYGMPRKINGEDNYYLIYEKLKVKNVFEDIIDKDELNELILGIKSFVYDLKKEIQDFIEKNNKKEEKEKEEEKEEEEKEEKNENEKDTSLIDELGISLDKAKLFMKHVHIFEIIRKKIIAKNYKLFNENINNLVQNNEEKGVPEKCKDKTNWDCAINDKLLLYFIDEYGLDCLTSKINSMNIFQKCNLTKEEYLSRIYFLIDIFEEIIKQNKIAEEKNRLMQIQAKGTSQGNIIKISSDIMDDNGEFNNPNEQSKAEPHIKQEKFGVRRDADGNIIYPVIISNNLKILNLGTIVHDNKNYHSEKNIFPIGYKSVREHISMFSLDRRAEYTCEILDGGQKPQYKVTSSEDPEHPIIKDSSTACWSVVGNAINKLQGNKRKKVTISGTERFGLCDSKVSKLLATLPNADIVIKQMSKYNDDDNKKKK